MRFRYLLIATLLLGMMGCTSGPPKPDDLIAKDKYIDLMVELQLIRSYAENAKTDSLTIDSLTNEVFKKYDVSSETFMASHRYYEHFPQQQQSRIEKAIDQLKMDQVTDTTKTQPPYKRRSRQ